MIPGNTPNSGSMAWGPSQTQQPLLDWEAYTDRHPHPSMPITSLPQVAQDCG